MKSSAGCTLVNGDFHYVLLSPRWKTNSQWMCEHCISDFYFLISCCVWKWNGKMKPKHLTMTAFDVSWKYYLQISEFLKTFLCTFYIPKQIKENLKLNKFILILNIGGNFTIII